MAVLESNSLLIAMWIIAIAIIFFNTLVLVLGLPKQRETGVNKIMLCVTMGSNYFTAVFLLIILSMDSGQNDFGTVEKSRFQLLCNLAGYFGVTSMQISLWSMLIAAVNLLLGLLFPRKFKRGKNYVFVVRTLVLGELTILLPLCSIPFLPISQFSVAQSNSWDSLCLPIHSIGEPLWEYSAMWFLLSTAAVGTLMITFALLICYLKRQKHEAANAIPMQARIIRKKSSQVKRMSSLMMSTALCWIPALSVCVVIFSGHHISIGVMQWVYGFVLPLSAAVGPLCYIINTGLSGSTMENCIAKCCIKAEKQGKSFRVRVGQIASSSAVISSNKSHPNDPGSKANVLKTSHGRQTASTPKQNGTTRSNHRSIASRSGRSGRSKTGYSSKAKDAPRGATWVQTVTLSGRNVKETFGVAEWQATNGSPRKGLLKLFMKGHFQQWKVESTILSKLNTLERHPNIIEYLWHSKSSHTRLDKGHHEHIHLRRRTTVERYICTSFYHHGTLRDFLITYSVKLEDSYIHAIATQVASGMAYLHSNSIIHNCLESTNILIGGHPENTTLKAVIANFTQAYDLTQDQPSPPTTPIIPAPGAATTNDDISTSWVDKFSTSVARSTIHDRVQAGASEYQMCANDVRSFALILLEMLTWLKQMEMVANRRHHQHADMDHFSMVNENQVQMDIDEERLPFVRNIDNNQKMQHSKSLQAPRREQQQHINVVCESLPEDEQEYYECNTFPRRKSVCDQRIMPQAPTQAKSAFLKIIHQKQASTCSTDSGVSSQLSSKANSCHSSSSGSSDPSKRPCLPITKSNDSHLSDVEFNATTEMWLENHTENISGYRPCVMEYGLKSRAQVPDSMQDTETDTPNSHYSYDISENPAQDVKLSNNNGRDNLNEDNNGTKPRSNSSLSQFYVRRRVTRPHSFSVARITSTQPNKLNNQGQDLLNARANVNASLRRKSYYDSSEMLNNGRQRSATPMPLPTYPGSAMPTMSLTGSFRMYLQGLAGPYRSATPPPQEPEQQFATIRRTRSRNRAATALPFSTQQSMNIVTNPKHLVNNKSTAGQYHLQLPQETIPTQQNSPMLRQKSHWDFSCPSGVGEQHLGYCQELQALFLNQLCLDGCILQQEVECGRAMKQWMSALGKMDGYLPNQLVHILEVCWSEEPAPPTTAVFQMLDNCLTEVAL